MERIILNYLQAGVASHELLFRSLSSELSLHDYLSPFYRKHGLYLEGGTSGIYVFFFKCETRTVSSF